MNMIVRVLGIFLLGTLLAACGGGGGGGGAAPADNDTQQSSGSGETIDSGSSDSGSDDSTDDSTADSEEASSPPATPEDSETEPQPPREVSLSWTPPSSRENGDPLALSDISGYEIYYYRDGESEGSGETAWVDGGSTTEHTIEVDNTGTYHFALAAVDINGLASEISNYVSVTL